MAHARHYPRCLKGPFARSRRLKTYFLFRACSVLYMLLNLWPVTLLLVSSTGHSAAKKSLLSG